MTTVSKELAERLKAAGLEWIWYKDAKPGDWFFFPGEEPEMVWEVHPEIKDVRTKNYWVGGTDMTWLPTLPDLLEWLEGRGYTWVIARLSSGEVKIHLLEKDKGFNGLREQFYSTTPADAAGEAVLWELEREKEDNRD